MNTIKTIEKKLFDIFEDIFNIDEIASNQGLIQDNIKEWDSIGHIRLISAIEDEFNIRIPIDNAVTFKSYEELVQYLKDNFTE